jgi:hypothetical protein
MSMGRDHSTARSSLANGGNAVIPEFAIENIRDPGDKKLWRSSRLLGPGSAR